jgi:hypothetical protein
MHPTIVIVALNLLISGAMYCWAGTRAALWWVVISALMYTFVVLSLALTRKNSK